MPQAIKEQSGLIFVQDPKQAKFDGMPPSAISTGLADYVAPAEANGDGESEVWIVQPKYSTPPPSLLAPG